MLVKDIAASVVGEVVGTDEADTLADAAKVLAEGEVGAAVVFGPQGPSGILSERDVIRALADGVDPRHIQVEAYMTAAPVSIDAEAAIEEAIGAMNEHRVRHLVVTSGGEIVGMLSARDLLEALGGGSREGRALQTP